MPMENINLEEDTKLNKCVLDIFSFSMLGLVSGALICPFFKNKRLK